MGAGDVVRIDYPDVRYGAAFIEIYDGTEWKTLCKCGKSVAREKAKAIVDAIRNFVIMSHQSDPCSWDVDSDRIGELVNAVTNMSETKHTPGPWEVETVPTQIGHAHRIKPINACLYVDHRGAKERDEKTVTALANARLIAAAPGLFKACKRIVAAYERNQSLPFFSEMAYIREAIARAEGET
jgi:hypothetical protein